MFDKMTNLATKPSSRDDGLVARLVILSVNPASNVPTDIPFALTLGKANVEAPVDYTSTTCIKIFYIAILKLPELFDG